MSVIPYPKCESCSTGPNSGFKVSVAINPLHRRQRGIPRFPSEIYNSPEVQTKAAAHASRVLGEPYHLSEGQHRFSTSGVTGPSVRWERRSPLRQDHVSRRTDHRRPPPVWFLNLEGDSEGEERAASTFRVEIRRRTARDVRAL